MRILFKTGGDDNLKACLWQGTEKDPAEDRIFIVSTIGFIKNG